MNEDLTLTERMGLGRHETAISRLIAAALGDLGGGTFLAALLEDTRSDLKVLAAVEELAFNRNRVDVAVLYEGGGRVESALIEVKVTSGEGKDQVERYWSAANDPVFLQKLVERAGKDISVVGQPERSRLIYLTVEPQAAQAEGVVYRTFGQWYTALARQREDSSDVLSARMLKDALTYLGPEREAELGVLNSVGANMTLSRLEECVSADPLLSKKLTDAVADSLVREFAALQAGGREEFTYYWTARGQGGLLEVAFYRAEWMRELQGANVGSATHVLSPQIIRVNLGELAGALPSARIKPRFAVDPYRKRKQLEQDLSAEELKNFFAVRDQFRDRLASAATSSGGPLERYRPQNYYLQVGEVGIALDPQDTLGDVARKIWSVAVPLAAAMDRAWLDVNVKTTVASRGAGMEDQRFDALTI